MSLFAGCCCFRSCQDADAFSDETEGLSKSRSYQNMIQNLCTELEKKKAELERLENDGSADSEDVEDLSRYGGGGEGRKRKKLKTRNKKPKYRPTSETGTDRRYNVNNNRIARCKLRLDEEKLVDISLEDEDDI